jgi:sugar lactone lactonase YvrE
MAKDRKVWLLLRAVVLLCVSIATPAHAGLLVSNTAQRRIDAYNETTGQFTGVFSSGGGLLYPEGMVIDSQGNLLVADVFGNAIKRFNSATGAFLGVFASVTSPQFMTYGPNGNLYVNSNSHGQVLELDGTTGAVVRTFSAAALNPGGLTFGRDGNLYVADLPVNVTHDGKVVRFNPVTGALIDVFIPNGRGGLQDPSDMTFGPDGNLYVTDYRPSVGLPIVRRYDGTNVA